MNTDMTTPGKSRMKMLTRLLGALLLETLLAGMGHVRNGRIKLAAWDMGICIFLIYALYFITGASFWTLTLSCILLIIWRIVNLLAVGKHALKAPEVEPPWIRQTGTLFLICIVAGALLFLATRKPLPVRYQMFKLPSASMEPTAIPGDHLIVDSAWYRNHPLQRGDVVALENPQDEEVLLKRCVGLPGDQIECRGSQVFVNGQLMKLPSVIGGDGHASEGAYMGPLRLGDGEFYCLGDNRPNSLDSRILGPISIDNLKGKALYIWFRKGSFTSGLQI